jgi:hypothetical protein
MTTVGSAMEIHRLLDEAFAGIEMTADVQDLKEEMRANLVARVAELDGPGMTGPAAARQAIAELGDIRSIVDETIAEAGSAPPWARNRVRPNPAFVVRTVILAVVLAGALAVVAVPIFGPDLPIALRLLAALVAALAAGTIVADSLRQETTTNYPSPTGRASGYGAATALAVAGLGGVALYLGGEPIAWLIGGGVAVLVAVVGFTYLGATQTNRHKTWVVRMNAAQNEVGDRFTQDPAAAARFGIYTVTIWLVAFAAFAVLSFTIGWAWSWIALVGGVVAMMVTLARMLFGATTVD